MVSVALDTPEVSKLQDLLEKLEAVAEEILCDREEIVSLDRRRNTNREALRALRNLDKNHLAPAATASGNIAEDGETVGSVLEKAITASRSTVTSTSDGDCWEGVSDATAVSPRRLITEVPSKDTCKGPGTVPLIHGSLYSSKTWMCIGDMFIRMPKAVVMDAIEKEQEQLDKGIKELRDGLRPKVNQLRALEGEEPTRGTLLKPLSREELAGVQHVLEGRF